MSIRREAKRINEKQTSPVQYTPEGDVHHEILTKVAFAATIPTGMTGTIYVNWFWFDPDDPNGSTETPSINGPGMFLLGDNPFLNKMNFPS